MHDKKSVLIPTQGILFVGFVFISVSMTVRLPDDKKENLLKLCRDALRRPHMTTREFSKLIGKSVASESGVEYAQLRYKPLEKIKDKELKREVGNFETTMYCLQHVDVIFNGG